MVIDADYRGPIIVALHNDSDEIQWVPAKSRIAQIAFIPVTQFTFDVVDNLNETERGTGGFGSTGVK